MMSFLFHSLDFTWRNLDSKLNRFEIMFDLKFTYVSVHVKMQLNTLYSTFMLMWILFCLCLASFICSKNGFLFIYLL